MEAHMQAYVYCRVSTREQATDNHYSLENQEKKAREFIKLKSWRVCRHSKRCIR
ncbi:MAG: recombinase family protein [Armatimonadota bacterium]